MIFNNSSLAWMDHWHRIYFGADGAPFRWNEVDFAGVARGFGWHGARVEQPRDLAARPPRRPGTRRPRPSWM